ncbi:MAG: YgfZ/GcvT domain-containing protein, partial [Woeseiaceae bacterium]
VAEIPMNTLATIVVSGKDAFEFLQGQLTNDLGRLDSEAEILAAWCNPKGRVIWFGTVSATDGAFALSAPADTAGDIVKRLTVFRFRSKVEFEILDEGATVDPAFLVTHGYAFIGSRQVEQFTPHMLNLDLLGAISLDKGCYTGQEIVARTHYKGATKRRTMRFESDKPVAEGDKVSDGNRDIGEVLNVAGTDLLAVVPVDKADGTLTVNGVKLTHVPLPYAVGPNS